MNFVKNNTGTEELGGANTFSGTSTIKQGTIVIGVSNVGTTSGALGVSTNNVKLGDTAASSTANASLLIGRSGGSGPGSAGGFTFSNNIALQDTTSGSLILGGQNTAGTNTFSGNITLGSTTNTAKDLTLSAVSGGQVDFTGNILANGTSTANLTIGGGGTVRLAGTNTHTGTTTVGSGAILIAQNSSALGTTDGGTSVTSGGALRLLGGITIGAEALTLNGTGVGGNGALRNFSGNNSWAGAITLGSSSQITSDAGLLTIGGNIDFGNTASRTLGITGNGNTTINGNFTNVLNGTQQLNKSGAGTLTLAGTNSGQLLFNNGGGTISISSAANLGAPTGVASYPDKFNFTGNSTLQATQDMTLGNTGGTNNFGFKIGSGVTGTFDVASGKTLIIDGIIANISGNGSLAKTGSGTLTLNQNNTYLGSTTISGGVLSIASLGTAGSASPLGKLR